MWVTNRGKSGVDDYQICLMRAPCLLLSESVQFWLASRTGSYHDA